MSHTSNPFCYRRSGGSAPGKWCYLPVSGGTANPAAYEPALAASLTNLSIQLADAGRRDEGLTAIQDAVKVYRRLAAANPAACEPDLATSLNNLSVNLAEAGRRDRAELVRRDADELGDKA